MRDRMRRSRVSLQNARRLAKRPTPTFLVLVVLNGDASPLYYAIHIWHDRIRDIFKAGRFRTNGSYSANVLRTELSLIDHCRYPAKA